MSDWMKGMTDFMEIRKIIDISRRIHPSMTVWPDDEGVSIKRSALINNGDICNLSSIEMGLHAGTHVDAPLHFLDEGRDIAELDLSKFIGFVKVFDIKADKYITREDIEGLAIEEGDAVFFKTSNSEIPEEREFYKDYVYIELSAAQYLVEKKVRTVGVDYLSVENYYTRDYSVHKLFLSNEIGIVENLNLKNVKEGRYFFSSLPLRIDNHVEGSPTRAVLIEL